MATKSHNDLCGMLTAELSKLNGSASTADARLTVLANWMEEQVRLGCYHEQLSVPDLVMDQLSVKACAGAGPRLQHCHGFVVQGSADQQLTKNLLLGCCMQLMHCVWPEVLSGTVQQIIDVARLVASLQPDGTGTPEVSLPW